MKKVTLIKLISLTLGIVSFAVLIYVDNKIANEYIRADGKTKAMFGILELVRFNYKYWILVPAILTMFLSGMAIWTKQFTLLDLVALLLGLLSVIGIVTPSWRLMV